MKIQIFIMVCLMISTPTLGQTQQSDIERSAYFEVNEDESMIVVVKRKREERPHVGLLGMYRLMNAENRLTKTMVKGESFIFGEHHSRYDCGILDISKYKIICNCEYTFDARSFGDELTTETRRVVIDLYNQIPLYEQ